MAEPSANNPACERCRSRRTKCDRSMPQCSGCEKARASCSYRSRHAGAVFMEYVSELEAEIAAFEQEAARELNDASISNEGLVNTEPAGPAEHTQLLDELFEPRETDAVQELVNNIGKISLSATSATFRPSRGKLSQQHHDILGTLVLSAAVPGDMLGQDRGVAPPLSDLPPEPIVQKVIKKYLRDVQPLLPFLRESEVLWHLRCAYAPGKSPSAEKEPYSIFLVGLLVATTALHTCASRLESALQLYRFSMINYAQTLQRVEGASPAEELRELEAVLAMAHFASFVHSALPQAADVERIRGLCPDFWMLSGIALRIAIDHGLHKTSKNAREASLFQACYRLDRQASAAMGGLPAGVPDLAVSW